MYCSPNEISEHEERHPLHEERHPLQDINQRSAHDMCYRAGKRCVKQMRDVKSHLSNLMCLPETKAMFLGQRYILLNEFCACVSDPQKPYRP